MVISEMNFMLTTKVLSEEDIDQRYITQTPRVKWGSSKNTMNTNIRNRTTGGKINTREDVAGRETGQWTDDILRLNENNSTANIESERNIYTDSHGLQQVVNYARNLDFSFVGSSGFIEHDFLTGKGRVFGLNELPTEEELVRRYRQEAGLSFEQEAIIFQPLQWRVLEALLDKHMNSDVDEMEMADILKLEPLL